MTLREVILKTFETMGYEPPGNKIDLLRSRYAGYVNSEAPLYMGLYGREVTMETSIIAGSIQFSDIPFRPNGKVTITQDKKRLIHNECGNPTSYFKVHGGHDGPASITCKPAVPWVSELNDIVYVDDLATEPFLKAIYVREKMYANRCGTPSRIESFDGIVKDNPFGNVEQGKIYAYECDGKIIITYKCPCGCGKVERFTANTDEKRYRPERGQSCHFVTDGETISIIPSLRQCYANYTIRKNKVIWRRGYYDQ